jgi:hypothetical protein
MPADKGGIYQRGGFWLDHVRGAGGRPSSSRLYIWWYDRDGGRLQRKSTGESDVRLAQDILDKHYLAVHQPTPNELDRYSVAECMIDYWVEHGSLQISKESIKARLKLLTRFMDVEATSGRLRNPFLPVDIDNRFLKRFRDWALADPIVALRKDGHGNWIDGQKRPRKASTVEESVIQLKAALRHAYKARRIRSLPPLEHRTRDQVTPERSYRLSIDGLAELLDYSFIGAGKYGGHAERLLPLRRYLIGAICTLGRPDAILDMSVEAMRMQWVQGERRFNLNPAGRIQTKKVRPIVPVVDLLDAWLRVTDQWFVCREIVTYDAERREDVVRQLRVGSVRSGWDGARTNLIIPPGWGPKLIRHSMSSLLANRRVDLVELEIALGHRVMKRTTSRYAHLDPDYLHSIASGIEDIVAELTRKVGMKLLDVGLNQ